MIVASAQANPPTDASVVDMEPQMMLMSAVWIPWCSQAPRPVAVTRTPSERAAAEAAARDSFAVELPSPAPGRARKGKKKRGKKKR